MSYYYTYYLGRRETTTGKVSFAGPYDKDGTPLYLMSKSRSYASDLHEYMDLLHEDDMANDVRKKFTYENWDGNETVRPVKIMPLAPILESMPFKCAYVPVCDLLDSAAASDYEEIWFTDQLTDAQYAALCSAAVRGSSAGKRKVIRYSAAEDEDKEIELGPEDYVRHMWVDTSSREYEKWLLSTIVSEMGSLSWPPEGYENVLLEVEG